jgi:MFS family permease
VLGLLGTGLLLLGGKAAGRFGPKPVVLAGLGVFTAASLVTCLAETTTSPDTPIHMSPISLTGTPSQSQHSEPTERTIQ